MMFYVYVYLVSLARLNPPKFTTSKLATLRSAILRIVFTIAKHARARLRE